MNGVPTLRQVAHQLMVHQLGTSRTSAKLALGALNVFGKLLSSLTPMLGEAGSVELFRRSLKLTEGTFPFFKEARTSERGGLLATAGVFLQNQKPDVAREASVALLTAYLELLASFIGHPLTWQLLQEAWPDLLTSLSQETPA
jgi:hypothetical protein